MVFDEALLVAQLIKNGDISPELLQGLGDAAMLQEAVGSHYDLAELTNGRIEDRGKMKLIPKQMHGGSDSPQTIDSLLMAIDAEKNGPVVMPSSPSAHTKELRKAGERILAPAGASQLAKVGLRSGAVEQLDGAERLARALDRIEELDGGKNPVTGSLYEETGLDGGHKNPHAKYGGQSADRSNMMFESKYENRTKGAREGDEMINSLKNSILKRLKADRLSPLELANAYQYDSPEVAPEIASTRFESPGNTAERMDSPGENRDRALVINSGGGDVSIGHDVLRSNGNGKNGSKKMLRH